jgi:hypothetical protein
VPEIDPKAVDPEKVYELVDPDGNVAYRKGADLDKALGQGYRPRTSAEDVAAQRAASEEEFFTSPEQTGKAIVGSALSGVTAGASDVFTRLTSTPAEMAETRKGLEHNPRAAAIAQGVGAVGSAVTGVGLTGLAGKAGAATGAGMTAEGALLAVGETAHEVSMSANPVSVERVASVLLSNLGTTAPLSGVIGVVGKAAQTTGRKVLGAIDDFKAGRAAAAQGDDVVADLTAYRAATSGDNSPWLIAESAETRGALRETQRNLKKAMGDTVGLAENPKRILEPLRREAQAIKTALKEADEGLTVKLAKEEAGIAADLGERVASGEPIVLKGKEARRYTDWSGVKGPKSGIEVSTEQAVAFKAAIEAGEVAGKRSAALASMPERLAQNEALQAKVISLSQPASKGLIAGALESAGTGYALGAIGGLMPGGIVGAIGAKLAPKVLEAVKEFVVKRLPAAAAETSVRSGKAIDAFMSVGTKAARTVPVLASKTLAGVSYGPTPKMAAASKQADPLIKSYRARSAELLEQVVMAPDGSLVMKPQARQALGDQLGAIRAADPLLADQLETVAARKIEFLANKVPKQPDFTAMQLGPSNWQPSDMDVRTFARFVAAVEDPGGVEERLADGTVTPEDAEAYRTVYPERFEDFKRQVIGRIPELRESLPYERKVALSIFTGVPVDPAMHPQVLHMLQSMYTDEPDTSNGTMAPAAQPQFGSVTKPDPTTAQKRAG